MILGKSWVGESKMCFSCLPILVSLAHFIASNGDVFQAIFDVTD